MDGITNSVTPGASSETGVEVTNDYTNPPVPMDGVESEEDEEKIIARATKFLEDSNSFRTTYEDEWYDYYELFTDYREAKASEDAWQSNLSIPITSTLIYQIVPRLAGAFINPSRFFARIMPNNVQNPEDCNKADKTEKIIQVQFRRMNFAKTMVDALTECAIYGNSFQKVLWKTEQKMLKRRYMEQTPGGVLSSIRKEMVTTFDGPYVDNLDIFYFFPDPKGKDEEMRRYAHLDYLSEYELKQLERSNVIEKVDREEVGDFSSYDTYTDNKFQNTEQNTTNQGNEKAYELMEFYEDGTFTFILNRKKIVRREVEPFFGGGSNLVVYKFLPKPGELYATGLPKLVKSIAEDINYLHNGMQDWLTLFLKRPFFADINRLEDPSADIEIEPFGIIGVAGGENINNVIKPLDIPGVDPSIPNSLQFLQSMAQMVSGINDYIMGRGNSGALGGGDTATGVSIITRQAMNRLEFHTNYIAMTAITRIIDRMIMLNHQYLNSQQSFFITDDAAPVQAGPEDLVLDYDIVPRIDAGQATKDVDRQQFMQWLQTVANIQPMAAEQNWRKLAERGYKMFEIENPAELLLSEMQKQQNMMMAQQQQEQQFQRQMMMQEAKKGIASGGPPPPPQGPPGGTPPKPPPYGSDEDIQRMVSRAMIGNGDRAYENAG